MILPFQTPGRGQAPFYFELIVTSPAAGRKAAKVRAAGRLRMRASASSVGPSERSASRRHDNYFKQTIWSLWCPHASCADKASGWRWSTARSMSPASMWSLYGARALTRTWRIVGCRARLSQTDNIGWPLRLGMRSCRRPLSAHLPPCRPSRRKSLRRTDSGHTGLAAGTGLHAPEADSLPIASAASWAC